MHRLYDFGCRDHTLRLDQDIPAMSMYEDCLNLSKIASFASLSLCASISLCVLLDRLVLTSATLVSLYGPHFTRLNPQSQERIRFLHIGLLVKILSLVLISLSLYAVLVDGNMKLSHPFSGNAWGIIVTPWDLAFLAGFLLSALYIFELISDGSMRPLGVIHHLGAASMIPCMCIWFMSSDIDQEPILEAFRPFATVGMFWVFFASLTGLPSRFTAIFRRYTSSHCGGDYSSLFYFVFCIYLVFVSFEAIAVGWTAYNNWKNFPLPAKIFISTLQLVFTLTKLRVSHQILAFAGAQGRAYKPAAQAKH